LEEQHQGLIAAFERNRPLDTSSSSIDEEEEEEETTVKFLGFSCSGKKYDIVHNRSSSSFHGEGNNGEVFFQEEAQKNENYTYEECGGSRGFRAVGIVSTEPAVVVTVAELAPSTSHQEQQQD
jgi:hypothetical protein